MDLLTYLQCKTTYYERVHCQLSKRFTVDSMLPEDICISLQTNDGQPLNNVSRRPACDWLPQTTSKLTRSPVIGYQKLAQLLIGCVQ